MATTFPIAWERNQGAILDCSRSLSPCIQSLGKPYWCYLQIYPESEPFHLLPGCTQVQATTVCCNSLPLVHPLAVAWFPRSGQNGCVQSTDRIRSLPCSNPFRQCALKLESSAGSVLWFARPCMIWLCRPLQLLLCLFSSITLYTCLLFFSPTCKSAPASRPLHLLSPLPRTCFPQTRTYIPPMIPIQLKPSLTPHLMLPPIHFLSHHCFAMTLKLAYLFICLMPVSVLPQEHKLHEHRDPPSSLFSLLDHL